MSKTKQLNVPLEVDLNEALRILGLATGTPHTAIAAEGIRTEIKRRIEAGGDELADAMRLIRKTRSGGSS